MVLTCITREALASTSAATSATACADCLTSYGVDPLIAGPIAVIVGVLVRLGVDWLRERLAERRLRAAVQPPQPPKTDTPPGDAP